MAKEPLNGAYPTGQGPESLIGLRGWIPTEDVGSVASSGDLGPNLLFQMIQVSVDCMDNLVGDSAFSGSGSGRGVGPRGSHRAGRVNGIAVGHRRLRFVSGGS